MGTAILWAACVILGVPSALLISLNWLSFIGWLIESRRGHKRNFSFCPPFLCGIAGAFACLICPWPDVWRWAWVPPLIDPSIGLLLIAVMLHLVARVVRLRSPFDSDQPPTETGAASNQPSD